MLPLPPQLNEKPAHRHQLQQGATALKLNKIVNESEGMRFRTSSCKRRRQASKVAIFMLLLLQI
jgi:hypothetical protein